MRENTKNYKLQTTSLSDNLDIVTQQTLTVQLHDVEKVYRIAADNKKNWTMDTVYCPGYFNNKTNFRVGNQNSLIIVDKHLQRATDEDNTIELTIQRQKDGIEEFIVYPIPCFNNLPSNEYLNFNIHNITGEIHLSNEYGIIIGKLLADNDNVEMSMEQELFAEVLINTYKTKYSNDSKGIKKEIIINSNFKFMLGILEGYQLGNNSKGIIINKNVNIYTFTTILNYLGASYSIRNSVNDGKKLFFQLPRIFEKYTNINFLQQECYVIEHDEITKTYSSIVATECEQDNSLYEMVNSGKILLVPIHSINFVLLEDNKDNMYDMTSERKDATNYTIPFGPILKNSDGDILGVQGLFTKEALQDGAKFSPENREYYKNTNDGSINNWIADDAILGLYVSTK